MEFVQERMVPLAAKPETDTVIEAEPVVEPRVGGDPPGQSRLHSATFVTLLQEPFDHRKLRGHAEAAPRAGRPPEAPMDMGWRGVRGVGRMESLFAGEIPAMVMRRRVAPVLVCLVSFFGCSAVNSDLTCVFKEGGVTTSCGEWSNTAVQYRTTIEALCRASTGDFSTGHNCPTEGRIGGCSATSSDGDGLTWYYPSQKTMTLADVKRECGSDRQALDATGKPIEGNVVNCSMPTSGTVVVHFVNHRATPVSVYYRDGGCVETFKVKVEADPARRQLVPSKPGDVYVVREGDINPAGAIVKEVVVGTDNPTTVDLT